MTETTQPDPQVVAWIRRWRDDNQRQEGGPAPTKARAMLAWLNAHGYDSIGQSPIGLREFIDAYNAPTALTVADIPAGQGAASLAVVTRAGGRREVVYKRADSHLMHLHTEPAPGATAADAALWDHLAATLRTVTEETP